MIIVTSCETEDPEIENHRLKKITIKDMGYIEFIYDGNQVSQMIWDSPMYSADTYIVFDFFYENDELYKVLRHTHPDSLNSIPSGTTLYGFDFCEGKVEVTFDYDTSTIEVDEKEIWYLNSDRNLFRREIINYRALDYRNHEDYEWEDGNLIQSQFYKPYYEDSLTRVITYQYDTRKSYSLLFSKDFLLAMCWIKFDYYFDYFQNAMLSVNNCISIECEYFERYLYYTYLNNGLPKSIQLDNQWFDSVGKAHQGSIFYEHEYE